MSDLAAWRIELPRPSVEPSPRWVRVVAGDVTIADSRSAALLSWYGPDMLPTYCFDEAHVRSEFLVPSDGPALPFSAAYDVVVEGLRVESSAFRFDAVTGELAALAGHWTFSWDGGLRWFEEALEVHVHARDPHKRVDAVPSARHIRVALAGQVVAESTRPVAVFETTLPTRWYLPIEDVRTELLVSSATTSRCPYKGTASYFTVAVGGDRHEDVAWTYRDPVIECPRIRDLVAFFNERVDLFVDGELQARPLTPWSTG